MTLLLPLPFGPTTEEKHCKRNHTSVCYLLSAVKQRLSLL